MNGVRSTFMRRGYLLTALSAAAAARGVPWGRRWRSSSPVTPTVDLKSIRIRMGRTLAERNVATITVAPHQIVTGHQLNKAVPVGSTVTADNCDFKANGAAKAGMTAEAADISLASI